MITICFPLAWTWWQCMNWVDERMPDRRRCAWTKFKGYWEAHL